MRLLSRALAAAAVFAGTVGFAVVGAAAPAHAFTKDPLKVSPTQDAGGDYGPLIGNFPGSGNVNPEPTDCTDPTPYCDNIPIDVTPPKNVDQSDDWYVVVSVSWEPTGTDPSDTAQVNDIDVFTYDDGQHATPPGKDKVYSDTGDSASSANPEVVKLFKPALGRYNLDVVNFSGANQAYHVHMHMVISKFERPFESLAPPPPSPFSGTRTTPSTLPLLDTTPAGSFDTTTPTVAPPADVAIVPDSQLASKPASDFNQQLAAPPSRASAVAAVKPPGPVSGLALLLAFLVLPGGVLTGVFVLVRRQRRALFSFSTPAAG